MLLANGIFALLWCEVRIALQKLLGVDEKGIKVLNEQREASAK